MGVLSATVEVQRIVSFWRVWVSIPALLLASCLILAKRIFSLSLRLSHLQEVNNNIYLEGLFERWQRMYTLAQDDSEKFRYWIYGMNGTWDHEKFHRRTYILPRTCNSMTWPNEGDGIRGLEGEGVRNSWILRRGASPCPSGGWTFCEGSSHQISRVWMSSFCLISLPVCLWLISAHFTHQICFDYLRLCRASTSLQEWAGSASASHSPDRAVSFISIMKSW